MTDFSRFGSGYEKVLDDELRAFGGNARYFAWYKAEWVRRHLGDDFSGRILDYGCGLGLVAKSLMGLLWDRAEITGYDVTPALIDEALKDPGGVMFTGDISRVGKGYFDAMIMANVLHHTDGSQRPVFLRWAAEFLKKEGRLFVFEHNPYNPITRLIVRMSVIDKDASLLSLADTVKLLRGAGMKLDKKGYIVFFPAALGALRFLEAAMGGIPLGAQYVCVSKRGG